MTNLDIYRAYGPDECGADGYPTAWHDRIKHEVRGRAADRCCRCKHPYIVGGNGRGEWSPCDERCTHTGPQIILRGDPPSGVTTDDMQAGTLVQLGVEVAAQWRILTVHHLDGDKANCRWWNLVALCQRCHLQIQGKVQMGRVWPWEHTVWFKPYAAGYYAHAYLGQDIGRVEAELRLEELLALKQVVA